MNPMDMLKNLPQMQQKLQEAQERIKEVRVVGTSGGDMVRVEMDGQFHLLSVKISPEVVDPQDVPMLQDLIVAAHNDAVTRLRERLQSEISSLTGGLPIPPGLFG